jgi:type IV secretory pathway VirB2 component (pilin)
VKALRLASDGMLLLAIVLLVVAVVGPTWAYGAAGFSLLGSVVLTVVRRRFRRGRAVQT